ncbi:glycosyltransferase family 4 protein [Daejeonia sp. YH14]|uniref:glycosyltransferase family 4 protein n=1 Tax=Daejeonia sp. YH14 TaxID=3439042 RepID=UPI003F492052
MKLLYITNGINGSGGLERVLSVKASALADDGYEVSILVLNAAHEHPFYPFSNKIKWYSITVGGNPMKYWTSYKRGIQSTVDDLQPDIISVCDDGLKGFFVPSFLKTKAKIIYERHASIQLNTDQSLKGKLIKFFMQRQVSKFDTFVVLTKGNIQEWNQPNVIAIPNPLSFESKTENPLNQKRILAVGSHSWNKGYDTLLEIWKNLEDQFPDWQLDIFGKIDKNKTFVKKAQELNLQNVHFYPPVKDIQKEYEKSSVLVLPSRSEGFGMVLIEAMECGVPCVAFDCPSGPADIITNEEDGFLITPESIDEMKEKLSLLIVNEDLRKAMGQNAKENVKRFSQEVIVQQWDELFKNLMKP